MTDKADEIAQHIVRPIFYQYPVAASLVELKIAAALRSYAAETAAERDRLAKEATHLRSGMTILRAMIAEPGIDGTVSPFERYVVKAIDRALSAPTPEGGGG